MKEFKITIGILSVLVLLSSCKNELSPTEYVTWVHNVENGARKVKKIGEITVDAQYKPVPYVIANEFRQKEIVKEKYERREKELEGMQYYNLKISPNASNVKDLTYLKAKSIKDHQEHLYYYSYLMKDDIHLVDGKDTLACKLYHFERSFDLAKHRNFVVAFEKRKQPITEDKVLIIDSNLFGTGPVKIKFDKKDLANLPDIKLKS